MTARHRYNRFASLFVLSVPLSAPNPLSFESAPSSISSRLEIFELHLEEKMRNMSGRLTAALLLALVNIGIVTAQVQRTYRDNDRTMRSLIQRIETRTDTFSRALENALDRSRLNGTAREDEINRLVIAFEGATDQLKARFENRQSTAADVRIVLDNAAQINRFLTSNPLESRVGQDWRLLQADLDLLARSYYINDWQWTTGGIGSGAGYGRPDPQVRQLVRTLENRATRFSRSLRADLNRRTISGRERQDAQRHLSEFETALAGLRNRVNTGAATETDVQAVLEHAAYLNSFVNNNQLNASVESDWVLLRNDLDRVAASYNVAGNWSTNPNPRAPVYGSNGQLTGTFRLTSQTGDARVAAENATRDLPAAQRQRVLDSLVRRLDPPDVLAIDQRGNNVTIASSRAAQINFVADGREHVETTPNGRTVRVRASLSGNQLTIERSGERSQDFTVTFDPSNNGRRLVVTRRLFSDQLSQPVTVQSHYDRTSEVAQLDLYRDVPASGVAGDFVIPNGTELVAVMNSDLSTQNAQEGDRFTATVRSPNQYDGATIEGRVTAVDRSGRVSGRSQLSLAFDTIRLRDGRTYQFAGILETVRTPNNEVVRVDNEGAVRDSDQTNRTVTRTAIGTAVGAIIGAIAGGGKGAAIGAVIGAGAGAGSVYVQGRDDLQLPQGTEITIRSTGPR